LVSKLKVISEKELQGKSLTQSEYDLIESYGGQLEHFWMEVHKDAEDGSNTLADNPAAIVTDVATDPNGRVLQEATGYVFDIYAVVPVGGAQKVVKGGVYSYYEFEWPLNDRLTDKAWREMLNSGLEPDLPVWTNTYMIMEND